MFYFLGAVIDDEWCEVFGFSSSLAFIYPFLLVLHFIYFILLILRS
jgi:hypothetical protein